MNGQICEYVTQALKFKIQWFKSHCKKNINGTQK